MNKRVEDLLARRKRLAEERRSWEPHWQELAEMLLPRRADFIPDRTLGAKRTEKQFDSVPMQAARGLAAALDGLLKPKSERWFHLRAEDEELNRDPEVKRWFEHAESRLFARLYEPQARFLQRSAEVDLDLVVFGTGALYVGERVGAGGLLFRSHHLRGFYIAENADGDIDTVFREFDLTARQAAQQFGEDKLGDKTREALKGDAPDRRFKFLHVVQPRAERDPRRRDKAHLPFASVFVDMESQHLIGEGGFQDFPYIVPRWETATDEVYGRSPGMLALPEVNTLNQMGKTLLRAGHKVVDPPLLVPDDGITGGPRTYPGGITAYDAGLLRLLGGRAPVTPLQTGANLPLGREMQNDSREQVWSAFFRNVLQLPVDSPKMTATEVLERKEEFLRVIGPTFGRLEADYTAPLIQRAFHVLYRAGAFAPPPDKLRGRDLGFDFASPVTKARKQIEATALRKTIDDVGALVAANPRLLDNFDDDQIVRDVSEANGVPQRWLKPPEEVARKRLAAPTAGAGMPPGPGPGGPPPLAVGPDPAADAAALPVEAPGLAPAPDAGGEVLP